MEKEKNEQISKQKEEYDNKILIQRNEFEKNKQNLELKINKKKNIEIISYNQQIENLKNENTKKIEYYKNELKILRNSNSVEYSKKTKRN